MDGLNPVHRACTQNFNAEWGSILADTGHSRANSTDLLLPLTACSQRSSGRRGRKLVLPNMQSLRRSCAACAKSKLKCSLSIPRCTRCDKRNIDCVYTNEPLAAPSAISPAGSVWGKEEPITPTECSSLSIYRFESLDPFDSYPQTRLPREHVQRLIHSCTL